MDWPRYDNTYQNVGKGSGIAKKIIILDIYNLYSASPSESIRDKTIDLIILRVKEAQYAKIMQCLQTGSKPTAKWYVYGEIILSWRTEHSGRMKMSRIDHCIDSRVLLQILKEKVIANLIPLFLL